MILVAMAFTLLPGAAAEDRTPVLDLVLPTPREGTSAVSTPQGIFIFGGYDNQRLDEILRLDPATGTLETKQATLPTGRSGTSAIYDGTHAYIFGGLATQGYTDEILRYDPETDTIETMQAKLPTPRVHAAAVWYDGFAYLFGGSTPCDPCATDQILRFDPQSDTITVLDTALPEPRSSMGAALSGSTIVLLGGHSPQPHQRHDDIHHFHPQTLTLTPQESRLPEPRTNAPAASIDGVVYLFGGSSCDIETCDSIFSYRSDTGQIDTRETRLESPRQMASAVDHQGHTYIIGGTGTTRFDQVLRYSPSGVPPVFQPPQIEPLPDVHVHAERILTVEINASHPEGRPLTISADTKPTGATLADHGDGNATLEWTPQNTQVGDHTITIHAHDGYTSTTETFTVLVNPADAPFIQRIWDQTTQIETTITIDVHAEDPQQRPINLGVSPLPPGASFTDHGDGTGRFQWSISLGQDGTWRFNATATADNTTAREPFKIDVRDAPLAPQLDLPGSQTFIVERKHTLDVQATHPQGEGVTLDADDLPLHATFTDHGDGTGTLTWRPNEHQTGNHKVKITAATEHHQTTKTLNVDVIRELDLELNTLDPLRNRMTPGETRTYTTQVTNTGAQPLTFTPNAFPMTGSEPGWKVKTQGTQSLDPGEHTHLDVEITAPTMATGANVRLVLHATNETGTQITKLTHWMIDVPLRMTITLDNSEPNLLTAATDDIQVTIALHWNDGSPATGIPLRVTHTMQLLSDLPGAGNLDQSQQAESDNDGRHVFKTQSVNPAAATPGDHEITVTAYRGQVEDTATARYTVTL